MTRAYRLAASPVRAAAVLGVRCQRAPWSKDW